MNQGCCVLKMGMSTLLRYIGLVSWFVTYYLYSKNDGMYFFLKSLTLINDVEKPIDFMYLTILI